MSILKRTLSVMTLLAVMVSATAAVGCDEKKENSAADVLSESQTEPVTEPPVDKLPDIATFSPEPSGMLGRAQTLKMINDDVVGYINIPETSVDYPVFQSDDNEAYMETDMYGDYLDSGSIFMDYRDVLVPDEKQQSNNIVLYGHNMLSGAKFATLHDYRKDDTLIDRSNIIEFSTNYVDYKYVIIGYFVTSGSYGESSYGEEFAYWDMENMDEKEFNDYVKTVRERSYIDTDVDVVYGDQLITLQTCFMDEDNSRFLVIGRRLRNDEKLEDFQNKPSDSEDTDSEESSKADSEEDGAAEE